MSREKERKRVMLCCSKKSTKPAVSAARSLFYSHPLFPGTFVTLFAFLNPFGNMVALDPFSLFSIRNRTNCLRTLLRWNRSESKVETYLDLSNPLATAILGRSREEEGKVGRSSLFQLLDPSEPWPLLIEDRPDY